jgi:hypothetical protein
MGNGRSGYHCSPGRPVKGSSFFSISTGLSLNFYAIAHLLKPQTTELLELPWVHLLQELGRSDLSLPFSDAFLGIE